MLTIQFDLEVVAGALVPGGRQDPFGAPEMEAALVKVLALADREEGELVAVVPDEEHPRCERLLVDARMQPMAVTRDREDAPGPRERLAAAAVALPAVHEPGVDTDRDVVQEAAVGDAADIDLPFDSCLEGRERPERVVAVEADVSREVVPRPERDADEGGARLERDRRDCAERPVAPRHADDLSAGGPGDLAGALVLAEDVRLDPESLRLGDELVGSRRVVPGAWVDDEEALGLHGPQVEPNGPWRLSGPVSIMTT